MAVATYTSDLTDIFLFESTTGVGAYGGGGAGLGASPDYAIEGTNAVDKQVSASEKGFMYDNVSNFTIGADDHFFIWIVVAVYGLADTRDNRGIHVSIGDDTSNFVKFHVNGGDTLPKGGVQPYAIRFDNTTLANRRTLVGTPGTTPSQIGGGANVTGTARFSNLGIDAARIGTGYDILNGTGADPEADFAGIASDDESTSEGVFQTANGGFNWQGKLRIGSASTACEFLDSNTNLFIINTLDGESLSDFTELLVENASSILTLSNVNFIALGTHNPGRLESLTSGATLALTGCGFIGFGETVLNVGSTLTGCRWIGAGLVTMAGGAIASGSFSEGNQATGIEQVLTTNPSLITFTDFVSGGAGHAVRCDTVGTFNWQGNTDSGYTGTRGSNLVSSSGSTDAMFYNNSGGLITLNVTSSGQQPSVRNGAGATTVVNANISVTYNGLVNGSEVRVYNAGTSTEIDGVESVTGNSFNWSVGSGVSMDIVILGPIPTPPSPPAIAYIPIRQEGVSFTADTTLGITQVVNRNYRDDA